MVVDGSTKNFLQHFPTQYDFPLFDFRYSKMPSCLVLNNIATNHLVVLGNVAIAFYGNVDIAFLCGIITE